jgi:DNA-binding transcriptional LysR family regulator
MRALPHVMRRLRLRHLNVLLAVVRCRSIRKAAGDMLLTQPAVSKTLSELEALVGVPLFDRSAAGVEPTVYGLALARRAAAALDELGQGLEDLSFLADPSRGELRVGASEGLAAGLLPAVAAKLLARHPGIVLNVVTAESLFVYLRELRERNIELALGRVPADFAEADMSVDAIDAEPLVVVSGENHPLARRRKLTLADLVNERWLLPPQGTAMAAAIERLFADARVAMPQASVVTMSIHMRLHLINSSRFVTTLPQSMLRHSPLRGSFKVLPVTLPRSVGQIGVVRLKDRTLSPVAERFLQVLAETTERRVARAQQR